MFYSFKYGILIFFIALIAIIGVMLISESYSGKLLENILIIVITCSFILATMLFVRCKLIYMDESGFLINSTHIPWSLVENVFFPPISPPFIIVKYKVSSKAVFAFSILPYTQKTNLKHYILNNLGNMR